MFKSLFEALEKLFAEFTLPRLFSILSIFLAGLAILLVFENYTAQFRLTRLQKAAGLMEQLVTLREHGADRDSTDLGRAYKELAMQVRELARPNPRLNLVPVATLRFIVGGLLWFLACLYFGNQVRSDKNMMAAAVGTLIFGLVTGAVGTLLPDFLLPWGNYVIYPLFAFLLPFWIIQRMGKKKPNLTTSQL
jgi:hypothetical protein